MQYKRSDNMRVFPFYMVFILALLGFSVQAEEIYTTLDDQEQISLTVYNHDLALIRDVRNIALQKGLNQIAIREVSARIRPETAIISNLSNPNSLSLLEQNFDFDLLTPQQLLQKYVGRQVRVIKTHPTTGKETEVTAEVLSANNGVVLRMGDRIETGVPGRIVYDDVPDNLRDRPTLSLMANSSVANTQKIELSYLTSGLSWQADYVARVDKADKYIDLNGWVTLTNQSGASYKKASLQLVAGDLNRVRPEQPVLYESLDARAVAKQASSLAEEGLFEYHLYTLGHATDVLQNQTKQVALLSAAKVPIRKEYLLTGHQHYYYRQVGIIGEKLNVGVFVEFDNKKQNNLGIPLPKGVVRVYKNDSSENVQFIGEDRISHTPKDEKVRLKLGDAFDVTANKKQVSYRKESAFGKYKNAASSKYEIELHNAKDEEVAY